MPLAPGICTKGGNSLQNHCRQYSAREVATSAPTIYRLIDNIDMILYITIPNTNFLYRY